MTRSTIPGSSEPPAQEPPPVIPERRTAVPGGRRPGAPHRRRRDPLREAERQLSGILAITGEAIITTDAEQRILVFNRGAETIFGYSAAEVEGQPLEMLVPESFRPDLPVRDAASEAEGRHPVEPRRPVRGIRKGGAEFPAEASVSRLDLQDSPVFTLVLRDVTERLRAEEERATLLARERSARARAEAAVAQARFLAGVSEALARTLDYDQTLARVARLAIPVLADGCVLYALEEGERVRRAAVAHHDPATEALLAEVLDASRAGELEGEVLRVARSGVPTLVPDTGAWRPGAAARPSEVVEVLAALGVRSLILVPLRARGHTLGVVMALGTEVGRRYGTDDLAFIEALATRAALALDNARLFRTAREAILLRNEVLGTVSHDLRNPLSVIGMSVALLTEGRLRPELARERLDSIRNAAAQMERLINDLLEVSRIEAGGLQLDRAAVPPADLLAAACDAWTLLAAAKSIRVEVRDAGGLPAVLADAGRILEVFSNLIGNAVRFTPERGAIVLGAEPDAEGVRFVVSDNGPGIPAAHIPHVFDRFWQAHENRRGGAGLGLAIAKGLVEAHGGRIWVQSEAGHGATFLFTLPRVPALAP